MKNGILLAEADRIKAQVDKCRKEKARTFLLFSDLHTDGVDTTYTEKLLQALDIICSRINPDGVINLGDNLSMLGRTDHISNARLEKILTGLFDSMYDTVRRPLFLINGNHDAVGTDFFKPALFNQIAKGKYDGGLAHYHTEGSYFYVDYVQEHLRMVFLSVPYDSDIAAVHPTPLWAFGSAQLDWLKKEALNTHSDVMLFCHVPFFYKYRGDQTRLLEVWDGEKTTESYIRALCGWIDDVDEAVSIIQAKDNVIACFSGHTHKDSFWQPLETQGEDTNPLSCQQVVTTCAVPRKYPEDALGIAIDILVWNPDERNVHIVRFGDGQDRMAQRLE